MIEYRTPVSSYARMRENAEAQREQRRIRHDFLLALQDVYGTAESIEAEALMDQLDRRGLKVVVA